MGACLEQLVACESLWVCVLEQLVICRSDVINGDMPPLPRTQNGILQHNFIQLRFALCAWKYCMASTLLPGGVCSLPCGRVGNVCSIPCGRVAQPYSPVLRVTDPVLR